MVGSRGSGCGGPAPWPAATSRAQAECHSQSRVSRKQTRASPAAARPPAPSLQPPGPPAAARVSEDVLSAAGLRWSAWGVPFALTAPARSPGSDPPPATHTRHFQQAVVPHPDASPPTPHVAMAPGSDSKLGAVGAPASPAPARPASSQAPLWWRLTPGCRLCRGQGRVRVADAAWAAPSALTVL